VQYTYDLNNQLRQVIQLNHPDPSHNSTAYNYDTNGNLTTLEDANSHTTTNAFDVFNQLNLEQMPAGQQQTRTYDAAGNLLTLTDYNGKTTTYAYDSLNRLTSRTPDATLPDAPESFTYTPTGKRATMTDASGTTVYTYDAQDRLQTKATPQGALTYTYDTAGNLASMASSNANGVSVSYTYDSLNRLATVVDNRLPVGQQTTTYSYDPASNLATVTYPNGLQSSFTYDDLNRITAMNAAKASYSYTLSPTGNRTGAVESSGRTLNWSYDGIYRLTNETISLDPHSVNGSVGYGLDPVGNRLSQTATIPGIGTGSFTYDPDDRLSIETYDANGNTLTSAGKTFAYDFENRLKSMTEGTVAVTIQYDADGNRVAKTVNGVTTRYLVDDLNPTGYAQVVEEVTAGAVTRQYTYGLQRISQTQQIANTWTPSFYGYDGAGTVRLLTDSTGTVTDTYDYDAWGNAVNTTGLTPNVYLYRGEQYDPDLGFYCLRARYYDSVNGRFLSRDPYAGNPADPISRHKYIYADADPSNLSDPSGMLVRIAPGRTATEYSFLVDISVAFAATASTVVVGKSIVCIWELGGSWLNIGAWIDSLSPGEIVKQVMSESCAVTATSEPVPTALPAPTPEPQPQPKPQPCVGAIGECGPWRDNNKGPGDRIITYQTIHPAPSCPRQFGLRIFAEDLGGRVISWTGFHTGILRGAIVFDNIYPAGIPLGYWEGGAYAVPIACGVQGSGSTSIAPFKMAVALGIGEITISPPLD
jgi:RHS repeat-associated protein